MDGGLPRQDEQAELLDDISTVVDKKIAAMRIRASQVGDGERVAAMLRLRAEDQGRPHGHLRRGIPRHQYGPKQTLQAVGAHPLTPSRRGRGNPS